MATLPWFPLLVALIIVLFTKQSTGLKVNILERKIYRVIPTTHDQLWTLFQFAPLSPDVILWSGLRGVKEPVEFLAVPEAMTKFSLNVLSPANLTAELIFPFVQISLGASEEESGSAVLADIPVPIATEERAETIVRIPGTDLWTGISYKVAMPVHPHGVMTWAEELNTAGATFVQIDLQPGNLASYVRDGQWDRDAQWTFSLTEEKSWFTWDNRVLAADFGGILTWSFQEVETGHHIIVSRKISDVKSLSAGGDWRVHALWKPVLAKEDHHNGHKYYKMVMRNFPNGTITYTELLYRNISHYVYVDLQHQEEYAKGGKRFNDSLFTFTPADLRLSAKISGFHFQNEATILADSLKYTNTSSAPNYTLHNPSSTVYTQAVEETFHYTNNISFHFNISNFNEFERVVANFNLPLSIVKDIPEWENEAVLLDIATNNRSWSFPKMFKASKIVEIEPFTAALVSPRLQLFEDLQIPFSVSMEIQSEGGQLPGQFIKSYLESPEATNFEVVEVKEHSVRVTLNGTLRGTLGKQGVILLESVRREDGPRSCSEVSVKCTPKQEGNNGNSSSGVNLSWATGETLE